ncbi:MAG TPA: hypothetical protein VL961_00365 [Acidimicrobiales bacterium]|nr:hypothetical protein [Acidimicrobiales bacterium]
MVFRRRHTVSGTVGRERSCVRVLRTEGELREALQRAAEFEKRAAGLSLARSDHYLANLPDDLH